jgi:hypothetical protein
MPYIMHPDDDAHDAADALLSWYATGQLDVHDHALVVAHLSSCARCQRQLVVERRLIDEFRTPISDVDSGWSRLRARIETPAIARPRFASTAVELSKLVSRRPVAALVAAQFAILILAGGIVLSLSRPEYRALGSTSAVPAANLIIVFRPKTTEQDMRGVLRASGASLVGGPTSADAYLLHVAAADRPKAIARLKSDGHVKMAQPIDGSRP